MNSIYDKASNDAMISRINKLTPDTTANWGKMTVDQMLKHSIGPIDIAMGKLDLKVPFIFRIMGRMMKNSWLNAPEFKKNSPTAKELLATGNYDFEATKKELIDKYKLFAEDKNAIKVYNHGFWGKMTDEDWNNLLWKHLDHHLRQFGV